MLETKTIELVNEAKELMNLIVKQVDADSIKNMSTDELETMQKAIKLVDSASELMIEQSKMMDDMNRKLDNVLDLLRKKEGA